MSKSGVPNNQIVLTFEDILPEKSDATIKIKQVSEFLGYDVTKLKIVGHNISYVHNDATHHELTFVIKDKKTKVVDKLVIDFVQKPNQKKFKGVVSLVASQGSSTRTKHACIECRFPDAGTLATANYGRGGLFKVGLSTGELKTKNGSNLLFYDSPEQFEKHLGNEVQQPIKEKWNEKKARKI